MIDREFPMTNDDFKDIAQLAYHYTGIKLSEIKKEMIYSRLARRIRKLELTDFSTYIKRIAVEGDCEVSEFINAITTNLTSFFREAHHFEYLLSTVIPELKNTHNEDKRVRVWCCAASTGEEPYSIAMVFKEGLALSGWDTKILATDLDSNVLNTGKTGIYDRERLDGMSENRQYKWFSSMQSRDSKNKKMAVKPALKKDLTFKRLNLMDDWPMRGPFDVVFCRNVIIYFDKPTQVKLFNRIADLMEVGSYLFIGHSESLYRVSDRFEPLGKTIYRRI